MQASYALRRTLLSVLVAGSAALSAATGFTGTVSVEGPAAPVSPISGATVSLMENGSVHATTNTDASGAFSFSDLLPGTYTLEFTKPFFVKREVVNIDVADGQTVPIIVGLTPSLQSAASGGPSGSSTDWKITNKHNFPVIYTWDVVGTGQSGSGIAQPGVNILTTQTDFKDYKGLRLIVNGNLVTAKGGAQSDSTPLTGSLIGIATDTDGNALEGVAVQIFDIADNFIAGAFTGPDGSYTMNVTAGTYTVSFSKVGYDGASYAGTGVPGGVTVVRNGVLTPVLGASLTVAVRIPSTGEFVPDAQVKAVFVDSKSIFTGTTGADGRVTFTGVPTDTSFVVDVTYDNASSRSSWGPLGPGDTEIIHEHLVKSSTTKLRVSVVDAHGNPVTNCEIGVWIAPVKGETTVKDIKNTGDTNTQTFDVTLGKTYIVSVSHAYGTVSTTMKPSIAPEEPLELTLVATMTDWTITVVDSRGTPLEGMQVTIGGGSVGTTDRDGRVTFTGQPTGVRDFFVDDSNGARVHSGTVTLLGIKDTTDVQLSP